MIFLKKYVLYFIAVAIVLPTVLVAMEERKKQAEDLYETIALDIIDDNEKIPLESAVDIKCVFVLKKHLVASETLKQLLQDTGLPCKIDAGKKRVQPITVPNIKSSVLDFIFNKLVLQRDANKLDLTILLSTMCIADVMEIATAASYLDISHGLLDKVLEYCAQAVAQNPQKNSIQTIIKTIPADILKLFIKKFAVIKLCPIVETEASAICNGHTDSISSVCVVATQEGMRIVSGSADGTICIWNMEGKQLAVCNGHTAWVTSVCGVETREGMRIVSGSEDETIRIWDMNGKELAVCKGHTGLVRSVCIVEAQEGMRIVSGSYDDTVRIWDMNGKELAVCNGHTKTVTSVCGVATKEGMRIVSGSTDGTIRIWNMEGKQLAVCNGHTAWVTSVCVVETKDGMRIVSGSGDRTIRIWNMEGNQLAICDGHTEWVSSFCGVETKDGMRIVSGSEDKTIRIWDMKGKQLAVCNGHTDWIRSVCGVATKDGMHIVSGSADRTIRIWNMKGKQLAVCKGYTKTVTSVCGVATKEGICIVSGSNDTTIRIWNTFLLDQIICIARLQAEKLYDILIQDKANNELCNDVRVFFKKENQKKASEKNKQKAFMARFSRLNNKKTLGLLDVLYTNRKSEDK